MGSMEVSNVGMATSEESLDTSVSSRFWFGVSVDSFVQLYGHFFSVLVSTASELKLNSGCMYVAWRKSNMLCITYSQIPIHEFYSLVDAEPGDDLPFMKCIGGCKIDGDKEVVNLVCFHSICSEECLTTLKENSQAQFKGIKHHVFIELF